MPLLSEYPSDQSIKLIVMGDSGAGKTGALCSLASAGYNLRILDADNKLHIIRNILRSPNSPYSKSAIQNISYMTITEKMKAQKGALVPASAKAWEQVTGLFDRWKDDTQDLGSIFSWTSRDVLVIDTLTMVSQFAMNYVLSLNGRLGDLPYQSDWNEAQRLIQALITTLYDKQIKCHVVMNCHIVYQGKQATTINDKGVAVKYTVEGTEKGYPLSLGRALSPALGRYFDSMLLCEGGKIYTQAREGIALKSTNPIDIPKSFPLATGLADYFRAVVGKVPAAPEGTQGSPQTLTNPTQGT